MIEVSEDTLTIMREIISEDGTFYMCDNDYYCSYMDNAAENFQYIIKSIAMALILRKIGLDFNCGLLNKDDFSCNNDMIDFYDSCISFISELNETLLPNIENVSSWQFFYEDEAKPYISEFVPEVIDNYDEDLNIWPVVGVSYMWKDFFEICQTIPDIDKDKDFVELNICANTDFFMNYFSDEEFCDARSGFLIHHMGVSYNAEGGIELLSIGFALRVIVCENIMRKLADKYPNYPLREIVEGRFR